MRTYYESEAEAIDVATARYGANWVAHYFLHAFDLPSGERGWLILRRVEKASRKGRRGPGVNLARRPGERQASRIERPVERARAIFALMKGKARSEVVGECVRQGISEGTAQTQYSRWAKGLGGAKGSKNTNGSNVS